MSHSTKVGLAWGAVLLLIQVLLAAVVAPGLSELVEQGRRAASEAMLGGVGLIVLGLVVIAVVIGTHRHAHHGDTRH
jgi:Ca2+/H+ antiporter